MAFKWILRATKERMTADKTGKSEQNTKSKLFPETILETISSAFKIFSNTGALSGLILILMAVISLIWVNFFGFSSYHHLWETHFSLGIGDFKIDRSLHIWINDGLMALFFFYIGLEIKREIMVGELSEPGEIVLPIFAALGGMIFPTLIFISLQWNEPGQHGWGIPMATDIAFSLGILMLLGDKVPTSIKVFLTSFAIVDDLGAVLIIALFYSEDLNINMLVMAAVVYLVMWIFNILRFRKITPFVITALIMWYFVLRSGVHPTVAGILAAFAIPTKKSLKVHKFVARSKKVLNDFLEANTKSLRQFLTTDQLESIDELQTNVKMVEPPLQRMEYALDHYVAIWIMPLFALSNAGVVFRDSAGTGGIFSGLTISVFLSLVVGKVVGVTLFSWLAIKTNIAMLPNRMDFPSLFGISLLGGVGFTMSLFIANLAFDQELLLTQAKIGILIASFVAGLLGFLILNQTLKEPSDPPLEKSLNS